jgi:hypothetical protein
VDMGDLTEEDLDLIRASGSTVCDANCFFTFVVSPPPPHFYIDAARSRPRARKRGPS